MCRIKEAENERTATGIVAIELMKHKIHPDSEEKD